MENNKIPRYNIDNLIKENAQYNIVYGERSNGKSYQLKHKVMMTKSVIYGDECFMLVRRRKDEITTEKIERYFEDVDVSALTNGQYDKITMWRRELFLSTFDYDKFKYTRGKKIGYVVPLEREQDYAGASFLDVHNIIYEEFMSRDKYLPDEPNKLENLYCTVDRKRGTTKLWLCGNSISRICPYLSDWGLMDIMRKQVQGTIESKTFHVEDEDIKMSIEFAPFSGVSSHVIGSHARMMSRGEWQSDPQPHLSKSIKEFETILTAVFEFASFSFLGRYMVDRETGDRIWFICDKTKSYPEKEKCTYTITDRVRQNKKVFRQPYTVKSWSPAIEAAFNDFREDKIFYSTDLTGTDFKQAIDFTIKK